MFNFNLIKNLKIIFKFGHNNKKELSNDHRKVGILVEGKDTTFVDCEGSGPDAGLLDRGENTMAVRSKFIAIKK